MSSTEEALLAAIAALPEEDTPRLAFADYLDERGDEAATTRAEFIRLQVMLYRAHAETRETIAARSRAAQLLTQYSAAWGFPEQPAASAWYAVRRGFIDDVMVSPERTDEVRRLLCSEPVMRLKLPQLVSSGQPVVLKWLDRPELAKVRHFELAGSEWADDALREFLAFKHFPALTSLAVTSSNLTPAGVSALAGCERLRELADLRISFSSGHYTAPYNRRPDGGVRDAGARAIAASPHLANLRELALRSVAIGTAGALALAASPHLTELTSLILTENPDIGPAGRAALVKRFGDKVFLSPPRKP